MVTEFVNDAQSKRRITHAIYADALALVPNMPKTYPYTQYSILNAVRTQIAANNRKGVYNTPDKCYRIKITFRQMEDESKRYYLTISKQEVKA